MKRIALLVCLLASCTAHAQYVRKVTSINYYGYNGLNPSSLTVFNGKLYFLGTDDPKYVDKLMVTADGSAAGVTVVKQIDTMKQYPALRHLTALTSLLIFDNLTQLWKSDGTAAGTSVLANITVGQQNFVVLNNKVYFAGDVTNSYPIKDQLWQTDGTVAGTTLVKTINAAGPARISGVYVSGAKMYFSATDGTNKLQLWVSDGTSAGTVLVKRIHATGDSYPTNFFPLREKCILPRMTV